MLVDVHCHLDHAKFEGNLDNIISNAKKNKIIYIINNGLNNDSNINTLGLSKKYQIIKASLGLYPIDAIKLSDEQIDQVLGFIEGYRKDVIAIGEIGLDLHWDKDLKNFEKQKNVFKKFIDLAIKIKKPIIIHTRDAEEQAISILESSDIKKVILHCFGANLKLVEIAENLGYYFSIPTNVTYSSHFQQIVKKVDINKILTETDAPYLGPFKGKINEPANIVFSIKKIAGIKGMDEDEVIKNVWMNYMRVFG